MSDLISRQAAINEINKVFKHVFEWDGTEPLGEKVLRNVPSAELKEKKGKWKRIGYSYMIYKCTQCGNLLDFDGVNAGRGDANFCPNCGADMRGGQDE